MPPADVLALARRQRAALELADRAVLKRLVDAYTGLYSRLADRIDVLVADVAGEMGEGGVRMSAGEIALLPRYKALVAQMAAELRKFQGLTGMLIDETAQAALARAGSDAKRLVAAAVPGITAQWDALSAGAVESLLGFLDPDGPLYARLAQLGPLTAEKAAGVMLDALATGRNPRAWAGQIRDALGIGLSDALRMTRTVQLYAYREATRANYAANPGAVSGWYWMAELDSETCLSCVAQHGSLHPVEETLNDHHNGRCAMLPAVVGAEPPLAAGAGQAWFEDLSPNAQRAMMGAARFEAYQGGQFGFDALSATRTDEVYGPMRVEATLRELLAA